MYRKRLKKNIITALIFKVILLFLGIFSRRYLVNYLGTELNGVYSLFISILGFISVAEMGVGSAIVFSLYKPIVDKDKDKVSALYYLYRRIYRIVLIVIFTAGLIIMPFLKYIAKDYVLNLEVYLSFFVFLFSTCITYLFAHKSSFINAQMDNYVIVGIRSIIQIIEYVVQIIILVFTRSFFFFVVVTLFSNTLQGVIISLIFNNKYKNQINQNRFLGQKTKQEIKNKTKAMFYHKIGGLFVNTADSIIISSFISVLFLGIYSNYVLIVNSMIGVLSLVFTTMTTTLGQTYAKFSKDLFYKKYKKAYLLNYIMALVFFLGFYAISNDLITIIFNNNVVLEDEIVFVLTVNYFIQFMRYSNLGFKDASGVFYNDRHKPLIEGATNIILSLIFVHIWGIVGILAATIITNLFITHIIEPYVLYKYAFNESPKSFYFYNYFGISFFILLILLFREIPFPKFDKTILVLLLKGTSSVLISVGFLTIIVFVNKKIRILFKELCSDLFRK